MWRGGNRPGFVLLEAVVALVIIAMVAVGALASVSSQLHTMAHAQRAVEAEALAEDRLSVVQVLTSTELQSLPDSVVRGRFAPPFDAYTWRVSAAPMPGENYVDQVRIVIEWQDGAYEMSTDLYRPPPIPSGGAQ